MNVIKNNKFNKGIGEFTGADDSAAVSSVSMGQKWWAVACH